MAKHAIASLGELDPGLILTPERYDPSRRLNIRATKVIADCADVVRSQVSAKSAEPKTRYLVLDTGDAREGVLLTTKEGGSGETLGSAKKEVLPGDVIVSRLRPYLRQVAFVDAALLRSADKLVCSTEFYVLRSPSSSESIAFLVPWLLSPQVQEALAAAQEGGHHPRFNLDTLTELPIPEPLWERRAEVSSQVEAAVTATRAGEAALECLTAELADLG